MLGTAAGVGWFHSSVQKASLTRLLFMHCLQLYTANAATVKTQFYTLTSVSRDCAGTEHTQTRAESHSFALSGQVTLSLASLNNSFALEKMFSSQRINAASLFQSLWKTWAKWGQTCWLANICWWIKSLLVTCANIATEEAKLCNAVFSGQLQRMC